MSTGLAAAPAAIRWAGNQRRTGRTSALLVSPSYMSPPVCPVITYPQHDAEVVRQVPNFLFTTASPKSPVAGSPERANATAPTCPSLRDNASARFTTAVGLKHSNGSPVASPPSALTKGNAT